MPPHAALLSGLRSLIESVPGVDSLELGPDPESIHGYLASYKLAEHRWSFRVCVRQDVSSATALALVRRYGHDDRRCVVVTSHATSRARELLLDAEIGCVDTSGYSRVRLPGLVIHIELPPGSPRPPRRTPRLAGKAGSAAEVILAEPTRDWRVHDVAAAAAVSVGLAHRVLVRLEYAGLMEPHGAGPHLTRTVTDAAGLHELLLEEQSLDDPR